MELISYMKRAKVGDELELLSTDKGSVNDVPEWIAKVGHELISSEQIDNVWHIKVRKAK
jgi:TusA-related sulfurtransferase